MTNNTVQGNGTKGRGLSVSTRSTSNFLGLVSSNNITGCTSEGITIFVQDASTAKARLTGNRTTGNQVNRGVSVVTATSVGNSFGGVFQNNTSDQFVLIQNGASIFSVEALAQFSGTSNNAGVLSQTGTITDVPAGSLGIP